MSTSVWRIGELLNSVQSGFVGLLRIWSIPIVLMLSIASGYTTYYGMSFFITDWIAFIVTVAVQSIVVICTLELAGVHWQANLARYLNILLSLVVALTVSVSFSYFKFYEFSEHDTILLDRHKAFEQSINQYLDAVATQQGEIVAQQKHKSESAAKEARQAYFGALPSMQGQFRNKIGKGPFWSLYSDLQQSERSQLDKLQQSIQELNVRRVELRTRLGEFSMHMNDKEAHEKVLLAFQSTQAAADSLATLQGAPPVKAPHLSSFSEFNQDITPTFAMWENISWFALACAAMVDFFTVILSYRLEFTAPGPLTEEEKELAYLGIRQFSDFSINHNDELEFQIEKTELERARRFGDATRMFAVAFLLNRGYLRKINSKSVEFAPNLYPIIAEQLKLKRETPRAANDEKLHDQAEKKSNG